MQQRRAGPCSEGSAAHRSRPGVSVVQQSCCLGPLQWAKLATLLDSPASAAVVPNKLQLFAVHFEVRPDQRRTRERAAERMPLGVVDLQQRLADVYLYLLVLSCYQRELPGAAGVDALVAPLRCVSRDI